MTSVIVYVYETGVTPYPGYWVSTPGEYFDVLIHWAEGLAGHIKDTRVQNVVPEKSEPYCTFKLEVP